MFYTGGLPFNFARNPNYISAFSFAANHSLGGYVPPGYNKLRTTLLQQEKTNVERLLEPIKSTWMEKGVSIVSDGWSDPQRRPLINFMVVCESGPMFIKAVNCAGAGEIIEAKNVESNQETYDECHWITDVYGDVMVIKNFIMNHSMRLAMFNRFSPLKLLSVADTRFASVVVMLKRFKLIKGALESMIVSEQWGQYREDDQGKTRFVRDKVLDENWWAKVNYILAFTAPIYDMIRMFYSEQWLEEGEGRVPPHMDGEVSIERNKCFRRIFSEDERFKALDEYANFSLKSGPFEDPDSIGARFNTEPMKWWACFGSNAPLLQKLAFRVLGQPSSSSCCERNWSTYSFIHSIRRNKLIPKRAEDLVFVHNNLRLLSRVNSKYYDGKEKMWDVGGDDFGSMEDVGVLQLANLSLDEPELESVFFDEDANDIMDKENDQIEKIQ
ncbi:uncharacterized protein LOC123208540 [Mangifera indica]|uniref:uncharacterized protein LOC123208540 n=1 Tax=Mangifera indica TaxID=29780 RepID=UPI001CFC435D|nr:uncharacterized protein LOC123208540 [Mangifera indica]